ncbi:hypothetical protein BC833DRAFT_617246 [Globomyces pollinis-pini]|nr:hypothetical protein BC833DRAFT_617246 [Globomyces pollinis-pini]
MNGILPFIDRIELNQSEALFKQHAVNNTVTGESLTDLLVASVLQNILTQSGLNQGILGQIWNLSIRGSSISFPEFALAMFLTKTALKGSQLPQQLPPQIQKQVTDAIQMVSQTSNVSAQNMSQYTQPIMTQPTGFGAVHSQPMSNQPTGIGMMQSQPIMTQPTGIGMHPQTMMNQPTGMGMVPQPMINQQTGLGMMQSQPMNPQVTGFSGQMRPTPSISSGNYSSSMSTPGGHLRNDNHSRVGSNVSQTSQSSQATWGVSAQEKQRYEVIFKSYDPENVGFISGERAQAVFAQSGLRENMLAHIWNLSDMQNRGKLNLDEFCVAMHLVYAKLNGEPLPSQLPPNLVPPSQRDLSALADFAKLNAIQQPTVKRISPASSLVGLSTYAQPIPTRSNMSNVVSQDEELDDESKKSLLELVEVKRNTIAQTKDIIDSFNKKATQLEVSFTDMKSKSLVAREKTLNLQHLISNMSALKSGSHTAAIPDSDIQLFEELEKNIPALVSECKQRQIVWANNQIEKIRMNNRNQPAGENVVVNRAQQLLAERMAALGVKSTLASTSATIAAPVNTMADDIAKIEREKASRLQEVNDIETRFNVYSNQIRAAINAQRVHSTSVKFWNPSVPEQVKFGEGVGLKSNFVLSMFMEIQSLIPKLSNESNGFVHANTAKPMQFHFEKPTLMNTAEQNVSSIPTAQMAKITPELPSPLSDYKKFTQPTVPERLSASPSVTLPSNIASVLEQAEASIQAVKDRNASFLLQSQSPQSANKPVLTQAFSPNTQKLEPTKPHSMGGAINENPVTKASNSPYNSNFASEKVEPVQFNPPSIPKRLENLPQSTSSENNVNALPNVKPKNTNSFTFSSSIPESNKPIESTAGSQISNEFNTGVPSNNGVSAMNLMKLKEKENLQKKQQEDLEKQKHSVKRTPSPVKIIDSAPKKAETPPIHANVHKSTYSNPFFNQTATKESAEPDTSIKSTLPTPPPPPPSQVNTNTAVSTGLPPPPPPPPALSSVNVNTSQKANDSASKSKPASFNPFASENANPLKEALSQHRKKIGDDSDSDVESTWSTSTRSPTKQSPDIDFFNVRNTPFVSAKPAVSAPPPPPTKLSVPAVQGESLFDAIRRGASLRKTESEYSTPNPYFDTVPSTANSQLDSESSISTKENTTSVSIASNVLPPAPPAAPVAPPAPPAAPPIPSGGFVTPRNNSESNPRSSLLESIRQGTSLKNSNSKFKPERNNQATSISASPPSTIAVPKPTETVPITVGGPPPPPPPMPKTNADGTVVAVKLPTAHIDTQPKVKQKPKAADIGGVGPNMADLLKGGINLKKTSNAPKFAIGDSSKNSVQETPAKAISNPFGVFPSSDVKSDPNQSANQSNQISSTNPFGIVEKAKNSDEGWEFVSSSVSPAKQGDTLHGTPSDDVFPAVVDGEIVEPVFEKFKVTVLFDFQGTRQDDLTVQTGETIVVEKEEGEWFICRTNTGVSGWIPKAFVTPEETKSAVVVPVKSLVFAKVLFDFEARNIDELTCASGQIVTVVDRPEEAWTLISHSDKSGLIPTSFLEIIDESKDTDTLSRSNHPGGNGSSREHRNNEDFSSGTAGDPTNDHQFNHGTLGGGTHFGSYEMISTPEVYESVKLEHGEHLSQEDTRRLEAIHEMIQTERSYVESLKIVSKNFYEPLANMNIRMDVLFSNFLQILETNKGILRDFEQSDSSKTPIGSVFLQHLDSLEPYKVYCENLSTASEYLQRERTMQPQLQEFLKKQLNGPDCKHLDLSSYLLIPMQRVARYSLLLRAILHYTPKSHPHHDATLIALQLSDEFLDKLNLGIKVAESRKKIKMISDTLDLEIPSEHYVLDLNHPTRTLGNRIFLHEGNLSKNKSGRKILAYLFNDFLLLAHAKPNSGHQKPFWLYRKPLMLDSLIVREAIRVAGKDCGPLDNCCLQFVYEDEVMTFRAANVSEKRLWMNQVESAIRTISSIAKSTTGLNATLSETMGTLSVHLVETRGRTEPGNRKELFVVAKLSGQTLKSKLIHPSRPQFNQSLMFSVTSLDSSLQLSLYYYDKYSADEYLGSSEIQLDFLEYYGGKETELIQLALKNGGYESISIKLMYRPA